jgi:pyrimidine-nucleoside phosphorylase
MRMYDIIKDKRDGKRLSDEQIDFAVKGFTCGDIPDYQMSAFAMAVWFRGMDAKETARLTHAMCNSGDTVDLSLFGDKTVDKHSTGGVGDKTSVILLPIVAACGGICAKMSGRGLGHTGGTIDKLESFPGYQTELSMERFLDQVSDIGLALVGQSGNLTPADKKLYALRDVTATVDSTALIASSIMSKKLAAGAHSIVLDVKMGSGAFVKTVDEARELAKTMVDIGKSLGRQVCAVITDMDAPLGYSVGNALEIKEAIEVLRGSGPQDLKDVCTELACRMLELSLGIDEAQAAARVQNAIESGAAFDKLCQWIERQGSDAKYAKDPSCLPAAKNIIEVISDRSGYICRMDTESIGICASMLGAGRTVKYAPIDHAAGIVMNAKTGDFVNSGDVVAYLHTNTEDYAQLSKKYLQSLKFSSKPPKALPLIIDIIK